MFFGLGYGDLSVAEAMKRGRITTPHTIRVSENYVLLAGENCVIVEGEGDPIATPRPESETGTGFDYRQKK